jgi:hypothetical protein
MAYDQARADEQQAHKELLERILIHADERWEAGEAAPEHIAAEFVKAQITALAVARDAMTDLVEYVSTRNHSAYRWDRVRERTERALGEIARIVKDEPEQAAVPAGEDD